MEMANLIAYIPVLNKRYFDWLNRYSNGSLFLISQREAEQLLPRLIRMRTIALPHGMISSIIEDHQLVKRVLHHFDLGSLRSDQLIMPDEDVCHLFADKYLYPNGATVEFEMIWARWDMVAVKSAQPVHRCSEISANSFYQAHIPTVYNVAQHSPDWWRQVGALIFVGEQVVCFGSNQHFPTEYETDALGDPSLNRDAGQKGESLALHAEESCIAECANKGVSTKGASIFVTTFPCANCARVICRAGITQVFFVEGYSSLDAEETFHAHGVSVVRVVV
jgi:dCMP deaminase